MGCSNMNNVRSNLTCVTECIFIIMYETFAYFLPNFTHVSEFFDLSKNIKILHISRPEKFGFTEN